MSAQTYCPSCGYPNDAFRGACLICYANVKEPPAGNACPSCGAENPKGSSFCTGCQAGLVEGAVPQMRPDVSGLAGVAVGGAVAMGDEYVAEPVGAMDFGIDDTGDADFGPDTADEFATPPPPPAMEEYDTGAVADSAALDLDEFAPPAPPGAQVMDEGPIGPPPPPDTVDLDLDDDTGLPPPPPGTPVADTGPSADTGPADTDDELSDWSLDYDQ